MPRTLAIYDTLEDTVSPAHTALLVTDVQNDFCRDEPRQAMIPHIARLLEAARQSGVEVVYIQNTVLPDGLKDRSEGTQLQRRVRGDC